jgi:uncharacterized protein YaiL (DUF2058 family)
MNMRDQLLKAGLANKQQAKKAQREVSKVQHQKTKAARDPNSPTELSEAEKVLAAKREADRLLNIKKNEDRLIKEAEARAVDIIANNNLSDSRSTEAYYFLVDGKRIAKIMVHDEHIPALEKGFLAIVSMNTELGFALVTSENADKIRAGNPQFIICQHRDSAPIK